MTWRPFLGAWYGHLGERAGDAAGAGPENYGTRFRLWAPEAKSVEVVLAEGGSHALQPEPTATFRALVPGVRAGDLYQYRIDGSGPYPDPASRFQPQGVHGPSEVIDPSRFPWSDESWTGIGLEELIVYELHVGTFTPAGTFAGVRERLPDLVQLGVTGIELMPIGDFPGQRNWGYDGVDLFAPARCYGRPEDLAQLVDAAHGLGLAVLLDVVYNHFGPEGNYLSAISPAFFSTRHQTTWGPAVNFDGEHSDGVRNFLIENALHWLHEYHIDGLRLDATHAMIDEGERHFLAELAARVHESVSGRKVLLIAEDSRNLAHLIKDASEGGWGIDAVWADDFHHEVRRFLAGDHEGYYRDYRGLIGDIATTIRQGWFYCGQHSIHRGGPRGTEPTGIPPHRFVHCLQNHDQIGNRAMGERLHHQIDLAAYRAATALLLCSPATPLLFMGQEWAASSPFLFFTDLDPQLGQKVTEGRRREFKHFSAFSDPRERERIPDPQAGATFQASRLIWEERAREPHASVLRLYQTLLHLRRTEPALRSSERRNFMVEAIGESTIVLTRSADERESFLVVIVHLRDAGQVDLRQKAWLESREVQRWEVVLTTEDSKFSADPRPPTIDLTKDGPRLGFPRPGAVILRAHRR